MSHYLSFLPNRIWGTPLCQWTSDCRRTQRIQSISPIFLLFLPWLVIFYLSCMPQAPSSLCKTAIRGLQSNFLINKNSPYQINCYLEQSSKWQPTPLECVAEVRKVTNICQDICRDREVSSYHLPSTPALLTLPFPCYSSQLYCRLFSTGYDIQKAPCPEVTVMTGKIQGIMLCFYRATKEWKLLLVDLFCDTMKFQHPYMCKEKWKCIAYDHNQTLSLIILFFNTICSL